MFHGGRGATPGRRSARGTGRSVSWPRTAPTSAGGRKARACGGFSAGGQAGRSACCRTAWRRTWRARCRRSKRPCARRSRRPPWRRRRQRRARSMSSSPGRNAGHAAACGGCRRAWSCCARWSRPGTGAWNRPWARSARRSARWPCWCGCGRWGRRASPSCWPRSASARPARSRPGRPEKKRPGHCRRRSNTKWAWRRLGASGTQPPPV